MCVYGENIEKFEELLFFLVVVEDIQYMCHHTTIIGQLLDLTNIILLINKYN